MLESDLMPGTPLAKVIGEWSANYRGGTLFKIAFPLEIKSWKGGNYGTGDRDQKIFG